MNYLQPHRSECIALPKGWIREEYPRATGGISSRKSDVYYVSPSGKRVRSKPELLKVLGSDRYDLTAFDYHTGKINPHLLRNAYSGNSTASPKPASKTVNGRSGSVTGNNGSGIERGTYDYARGLRSEAALVPPIRQTASIFKQPVTVSRFKTLQIPTMRPSDTIEAFLQFSQELLHFFPQFCPFICSKADFHGNKGLKILKDMVIN